MEKEKPKQIVFANTAEAFEEILNSVGTTEDGQKRIRHELALSQRAFFWEGDNKIVVTPSPIPKELFDNNTDLLKYENVINYFPRAESLNLSKSIDSKLLELVNEKEILFSPYAITPSFIELIGHLRKQNINISVDNMPATGGYELVRYLDSKSGFRQEIEKLSDKGVFCPIGYICTSLNDLENKINLFKANNKRFIVKADQGESGWGLIIVKNDDVATQSIIQKVATETIWSNGPYIIEEYIEPKIEIAGGSPSAELIVTDSEVVITYLCGQIVIDGEFLGTVLGKETIPLFVENQIRRSAQTIGEHYQSLGYRGIFDIDYVISNDDGAFAVETNTRRTGGTHVYDLAKRLFGPNYINHVFISNDHFEYLDEGQSINDLLTKSSDLLFSRVANEGIVITLINQRDNILGYVAVGSNLNGAMQIANEFKRLWS